MRGLADQKSKPVRKKTVKQHSKVRDLPKRVRRVSKHPTGASLLTRPAMKRQTLGYGYEK